MFDFLHVVFHKTLITYLYVLEQNDSKKQHLNACLKPSPEAFDSNAIGIFHDDAFLSRNLISGKQLRYLPFVITNKFQNKDPLK